MEAHERRETTRDNRRVSCFYDAVDDRLFLTASSDSRQHVAASFFADPNLTGFLFTLGAATRTATYALEATPRTPSRYYDKAILSLDAWTFRDPSDRLCARAGSDRPFRLHERPTSRSRGPVVRRQRAFDGHVLRRNGTYGADAHQWRTVVVPVTRRRRMKLRAHDIVRIAMTAAKASRSFMLGFLLSCHPSTATPTPSPHVAVATPVPILTYEPHANADAAARAQYEHIDAELAAGFDYETGHQPVFASYEDLLFSVSEESGWRKTVAARERYEEKIDRVLELQPSSALTARALARRGSLSYSMLRGLMTLEERGFVVISPQLHASLVRVEGHLEGFGTAAEQEARMRDTFDRWRKRELDDLAERAIGAYAWAAVIARRYGVSFDDIRTRLESLRAQVGAKHFADLVYRAPPPSGFAPQYERLVENDLGLRPPPPTDPPR